MGGRLEDVNLSGLGRVVEGVWDDEAVVEDDVGASMSLSISMWMPSLSGWSGVETAL